MTDPAPTSPATTPIRVVLPGHLCSLAGVQGEVTVEAATPVTVGTVLDALEERFPMLRGAIRAHDGGPRRPFVRFYAAQQDLSLDPFETVMPTDVAGGGEPFLIVGAIAGG